MNGELEKRDEFCLCVGLRMAAAGESKPWRKSRNEQSAVSMKQNPGNPLRLDPAILALDQKAVLRNDYFWVFL